MANGIDKRKEAYRRRFRSCVEATGNYECEPQSLKAAARFFGVRHGSARDRKLLLGVLVDVLFGTAGKKGRPNGSKTVWDEYKHLILGNCYRQMKQENPSLNDTGILELIRTGREFNNYDVAVLRKHLPAAHRAFEKHGHLFAPRTR